MAEGEPVLDTELQEFVADAYQVLRAKQEFDTVMAPLFDAMFDEEAQRRAGEFLLTSPLLREGNAAFRRVPNAAIFKTKEDA